MVSTAQHSPRLRRPRAAGASPWHVAVRAAAGAGVAFLLVAGLAGGLRRAGVDVPVVHAAGAHAALMIGGFFATVIGIERAVALRTRWAWAAPAASGAGGAALAFGAAQDGAWLLATGAALFTAVSVQVIRRQRAAHTACLLAAALCGLSGALQWAAGLAGDAAVAAWLAFLVLTIAAERLEMTRLMRRRPGAQAAFAGIVAGMLATLPAMLVAPRAGGAMFGLALVALALWLGRFDVARITLGTHGLSRYMAVALLVGYAWLGVSGLAWIASASGLPARDAALHALGLGFVFSMVMAHAPVILPAVAGVKLKFAPHFYVPLGLLHGSLALRLAAGAFDARGLAAGAVLNLVALAAFVLTVLHAAIAWRRRPDSASSNS